MTTGQASLFEQAGAVNANLIPPTGPARGASRRPREEFLTGLLATWLAGVSKPTKEQREHAAAVARRAIEELYG